jgi:bacteriophage N4 adsorption protein B
VAQLRQALTLQQQSSKKLGQVLRQLGYISEEDLLTVLGRQLNVPVCSIDYRLIERTWLQRFPRQMAEKLLALPVHLSNGTLEVACANPAMPGLKEQVEDLLDCPVRLSLATETDLRLAISRAYLSKDACVGTLLGKLLVSAGAITEADLARALQLQKKTGRKLGEILQDLDLVTPQMVTASLQKQEAAALETELAGELA